MADHDDRENPILAYVWPDGSVRPIMPGKRPDWGQARWQERQTLTWARDPDDVTGFTWITTYATQPLDLRPEFADTDELASMRGFVSINRAGLFGSGVYMRILMWCETSVVDISNIGGLSGQYYEACMDQPWTANNTAGAREANLMVVSQPTDITANFNEGGRTQTIKGTAYRGAVLLTLEPPGSVIRFWQVFVTLKLNKQSLVFNPNTYAFRLHASVY